MKLITFVIPCYNSQDYMEKAIHSLLPAGLVAEIIIVNDGSKDNTYFIAEKYVNLYPDIVKSIHKENGGHGDAVMAGLKEAKGLYFKVVDSDDWVDEAALKKVMASLNEFVTKGEKVDMLISNYVYEKQGLAHKKVVHYRNALPVEETITWKDVGHFRIDQYILMHSVIYRTELLHLCCLELPKHTFYVDNIYVYQPLPHVEYLHYLDVDFYRYFIGRDDQSVNEKVMIKRIDQQIFVTKSMIAMYRLREVPGRKLRRYMLAYLAIMMAVTSILCIRSKEKDNLEKKKEIWAYLKKTDFRTFLRIRYGVFGQSTHIPGKAGRKMSSLLYLVARRIVGFN